MAETIKFTLENTAVFAERSRDIRFVSRVNETANELNMALNPAIQESGREIDENILKIVGGLAEEGEWPCDSVRTLIETVNDPHRTANKEVAEGRLEILAYSTYMAMTYGKNDLLNQAVGTKDGAVIDAALPESMKGVGALVAEIAINREITNPKLKEELRKLDRKVEFLNVSGVSRVRLREIIEDKIVELSSLVDELDERGYDELMRLSAFFGAEIQKLSIDNEVSNIPESVEDQLAICRALLAKIESSNKTTRDLTLGQYAAKLEEMAQEEGIFPEVATEIMARLKLHDSAVLMRKANGYIESPESGADPECPNVGMASTLAEGLGHALDSESIYFFLKTNSNGIPVAEAWDMYQKME